MKRSLSALISILLVAIMLFCATSCGKEEPVSTKTDAEETSVSQDVTENKTENSDATVLGQGEVSFTFTVIDVDKKETNFKINTDKKTVGEALIENELIEGEDGPYGLYVKTVNGTTLDYDKDGKYWAFYIGDEMAPTGVDMTDITDGAAYSFKAE